MVVFIATFLICVAESHLALSDVLTEVVSAFATVGSSTGITASLQPVSRVILIVVMFIGRLGPVTIANLLVTSRAHSASFTEENVLIG